MNLKRFLILLFLFSTFLLSTPVENLKGSLSVNQGALNYSVELDLPKGVAGVAPKISLNYSSNAGNGILGQGWSIGGLSSISLCGSNMADDGVNRAVQYDEKDHFCMDGQRLVEVGDKELRTQIESYSKIVYEGSKGNPTNFKVWLKSGDIYEYTRSKVVLGKNASWLLTKISDRYDNEINFNYKKIIKDAVFGRYVIDFISYANNKIDFKYDITRKDYFLGYQKGQSFVIRDKLAMITIKSNGKEVKSYQLNYLSQNSALNKLKLLTIKKCANNECSEPLKFQWSNTNTEATFVGNYNFPDINPEKDEIKLLDFNGDGFTDIYYGSTREKHSIWLNDKNGNFIQSQTLDNKLPRPKGAKVLLDFQV